MGAWGAGRRATDGCAVLDSVYMWIVGKPVHDALEKRNNNLGVMMQKEHTPTLGMRSNGETERQERCQLNRSAETRGHWHPGLLTGIFLRDWLWDCSLFYLVRKMGVLFLEDKTD